MTFTTPVVARTSSRARGVVAPRQRAARGGEERVPAQVHRRRAGVRVRAGEAHRVALDAERAEHRRRAACRAARAPGPARCAARGRRARPRARAPDVAHACRGRRRGRRARPAARVPSRSVSPRTASGSSVPAAGARAEQAAAEARALLVGPVDELERDAARLLGASARSTSRPPTTLSAPSSQPPFGTESRWPPTITKRSSRRRARSPTCCRPRRARRSRRRSRRARPASHSRAVIQVSVQATRWAPSSSPVSRRSSFRPATARAASDVRHQRTAGPGRGLRERAVHELPGAGLRRAPRRRA